MSCLRTNPRSAPDKLLNCLGVGVCQSVVGPLRYGVCSDSSGLDQGALTLAAMSLGLSRMQ